MSTRVARNTVAFASYFARDVFGQPKTGLTISDFAVTLTSGTSAGADHTAAAETVSLVEIDATDHPGLYEFQFTGTSAAHYALEADPTFANALDAPLRATFDVVHMADFNLANTLCTVQHVKDFLGGYDVGDTGDDSLLTETVQRVTGVFQRESGQTILNTVHTELTDGRGVSTLLLRERPVNSVTSVHESTGVPRVYDATTLLTEGTHFLTDTDAALLHRLGAQWADGPQTVRVIYDAGWASVPSWVNNAAVLLAAEFFKGRKHAGLIRQAHGDELEAYYTHERFPIAVQRVLDDLRRSAKRYA